MDVFLSSLIIGSSFAMVVCLLFRMSRFSETMDFKAGVMLRVLLLEILLVSSDLWAGGNVGERLVLDLLVTLIPLMAMISSVLPEDVTLRIVYTGMGLQAVLVIYYILVVSGIVDMMRPECLRMFVFLVSAQSPLIYMTSLGLRIRDVKTVLKSGTVWHSLCLAVESLYMLVLMLSVSAFMVFSSVEQMRFITVLTVVVLCGEAVAVGLRIIFDSVFVIWHRHERRIVESMKVSHVEVSNDGGKDESQYLDIYERVTAYFEKEKPYLNSELTIHDIVKVVFTNKLYISRAISQYTGRNFCQFVNYYRVTHSVNLFRKNPDMKVVELANASGFNSVVSFTMAFRLFMNENPSDWCRQERLRLIKGKNKLWNR